MKRGRESGTQTREAWGKRERGREIENDGDRQHQYR